MTIALRPVGDMPKVGVRPISMDVAQDKRTTILATKTALLDYWLQKIFEGSGPIPKDVRHALGKAIGYTRRLDSTIMLFIWAISRWRHQPRPASHPLWSPRGHRTPPTSCQTQSMIRT